MNKKKFLVFGLIGIFAMAVVTAGLVTYWGQTQVDMEVTEAITVHGGVCDFAAVAGGDYELCLLDLTNNLDREIDVDFTLRVQKDDGAGNYLNLADDAGVLIGLTEDVSYCFKTECANPETEWESWMETNPDWLDWYLTQGYPGEYDTALINNHGGDSILEVSLVNGELTFPESISALDEVQIAVYVDSAIALESGNYRVILEVSP